MGRLLLDGPVGGERGELEDEAGLVQGLGRGGEGGQPGEDLLLGRGRHVPAADEQVGRADQGRRIGGLRGQGREIEHQGRGRGRGGGVDRVVETVGGADRGRGGGDLELRGVKVGGGQQARLDVVREEEIEDRRRGERRLAEGI